MKKITNELAITKLTRNKKTGGLTIKFVEHIESKNGSVSNDDWDYGCDDVPHPDLTNLLYDLKQYLATCYGMLDVRAIMTAKGLQAGAKAGFEKVSTHLEKMVTDRLAKLEITGYTVSGSIQGEKDKRGVIISGTFKQENGTTTALNSPLIKFNQDTFKFENDVKVIIDDLETEITQYINGSKRLQADAFVDSPGDQEQQAQEKVDELVASE